MSEDITVGGSGKQECRFRLGTGFPCCFWKRAFWKSFACLAVIPWAPIQIMKWFLTNPGTLAVKTRGTIHEREENLQYRSHVDGKCQESAIAFKT